MWHFLKYYNRLSEGGKLPRKAKKGLLGLRRSKGQIRRMLQQTHVIEHICTIHDGFGLDRPPFCMECGCGVILWSGNKASYPELWEVGTCARCGHTVAEADNSPYYHEVYLYLTEGEEAHAECSYFNGTIGEESRDQRDPKRDCSLHLSVGGGTELPEERRKTG